MPPLNLLSAASQVAAHLHTDLIRGRWSEMLPGVDRLAGELGVNRKTVAAALLELEREGLLVGQGPRRRRLVVPPEGKANRPLRVVILLYEKNDDQREYIIKLPDALMNAGHTIVASSATLMELKMDVARISRLVKKTRADAWVVMGGSREVLAWFSAQSVPVFALFGRREGLPIPAIGPDYRVAQIAATRHLARLGHQRIVMLCRHERRVPEPGPPERAFLDELKNLGLKVGDYNLPAWEETRRGLQNLLVSLFRITPPTALIIDEPDIFIAAYQFLAENGLRVPQQISMICTENPPHFSWCATLFSHFEWDYSQVVSRITRWAAAVSRGRRDIKQILVPTKFVAADSISPAPSQ